MEEIQRRLLEDRQQKVGLGSVWRFFYRHGISLKKAFRRPSRIGLMLPRRDWHGRTINPNSIPIDWSSSMKPVPQPKWRSCTVGLRAVNGWSAKSRTDTLAPDWRIRNDRRAKA
jgi:hypothetical protein